MNDITPTTRPPARKPISPELSPQLAELLDSDGSPDDAAQAICRFSTIRDEARAALPALKAVAEWKSGAEGVKAVIGKRFALYPQPERSEGEWNAWWEAYQDVLEDLPLACLEAAMRAWVARPTSQFLPKPGELRELAYTTVSKSLRRYQRAKRALQMFDQPETPALPAPDGMAVDNAGEIKRMLAEFQAQRSMANLRPELPSIAGKSDETGLTPQMRALLERGRSA